MKKNLTLNPSVSLGDYIRKIRMENGYSQYDMANALEISQNSYCLLENGRTKFVLERIIQIAAIFELSPKELVEGYFNEN